MTARKTTLLVVFWLILTAGGCEAWRRRDNQPSLALARVRVVLASPVRGGAAGSTSEPSSTPDGFPHQKKKRRTNPKKEEVEDDDEYEEGEDDVVEGEEQEWFEASEELTGDEDIIDDNDGGFNVVDDDAADDDEPGRSRRYDDAASVDYEGDEDEAIGDFMSSSVGASVTRGGDEAEEESAGRMRDDDDAAATVVTTSSSSFAVTARDEESAHQQELDDGSSTDHMDRMDLADAYDDDVAAALTTPSAVDHNNKNTASTFPAMAGAAAVVASVAPAGAAAAAPTDNDDDTALIDAATERILQNELKYRPHEIKSMKPAVAAVVAAKRLHRPTEGMPRNWYREGTDGGSLLHGKNHRRSGGVVKKWGQVVLPRIIVPVAVIGLAIVQKESIGEALSGVLARARRTGRRRPDGPKLQRDDNTPYNDNDIGSIYDDSVLQIENDDNNNNDDSSSSPPVKETATTRPTTTFKDHQTTTTNELDVTWLDKCLTSMERRIKAFLRWEI